MKQFIFGIHPAIALADHITGQLWRTAIGLQDPLGANPNTRKITVLAAGTFRNLHLRCFTPVGAGVTVRFYLEKNGVDTGVFVTLSGAEETDYQNITDSVHCDVGDHVAWHLRLVSGSLPLSGTRISTCVEFDSDTPNECWYGRNNTVMTGSRAVPMFHHQGSATFTPMEYAKDVMAVDGSITALYAAVINQSGVEVAPGAGKWFETAIWKNGVRQDGSGGTVDTVCRIENTETNNTKTFILPVGAGDIVWADETNSGGLLNFRFRSSLRFLSDTEDLFPICSTNNYPTAAFFPPQTEGNWVPGVTESQQEMVGPITPLELGGMIGDISTPAGDESESLRYITRKNAEDTTLELEFVGAQTADVASGSPVALTSADRWSVQKISAGPSPSSGGSQAVSWPGNTFVGFPGSPPEEPEPSSGVIGPLVWMEWRRRIVG